MKNRLVFRIGTFFLSASFMMGVIHTAADQNVLAEEASGEELITIVPEETEAPQTAETSSKEAGSTVPEETETDQEVVIVPDVRETEDMETTEVPETETQETEGSGHRNRADSHIGESEGGSGSGECSGHFSGAVE